MRPGFVFIALLVGFILLGGHGSHIQPLTTGVGSTVGESNFVQPITASGGDTQASLPDSSQQETLADMKVGEKEWTVPWAMSVDSSRKCWLNSSFSVEPSAGGTVQLEVIRQRDGYHVTNHDPDFKWDIGEGHDAGAIPVR